MQTQKKFFYPIIHIPFFWISVCRTSAAGPRNSLPDILAATVKRNVVGQTRRFQPCKGYLRALTRTPKVVRPSVSLRPPSALARAHLRLHLR